MKEASVYVRNFRSLRGEVRLEIAPLTILVGENSSGKTALMAAISAALHGNVPNLHRVDKAPFFLTTPNTIVAESEPEVSIGYRRSDGANTVEASVSHARTGAFWMPTAVDLEIPGRLFLRGRRRPRQRKLRYEVGRPDDAGDQIRTVVPGYDAYYTSQVRELFEKELRGFSHAQSHISTHGSSSAIQSGPHLFRQLSRETVYAIAPIRSKPLRVYEQNESMMVNAEGEHVPQLLDRILLRNKGPVMESLRDELLKFSREGALFDSLTTKAFQTPAGRLFSIILELGTSTQTLQDVGYGVSQALPIAVDMLMMHGTSYFLIQQPEVHLHPRGQAALATFFVRFLRERETRLVVETHSDYIVDRTRLEIRNGAISVNDVRLYFLDKIDGATQIHQINIDEKGTITDPPSGFRSFFLREQMELLGF